MNRRGFLGSIAALFVAPKIVEAPRLHTAYCDRGWDFAVEGSDQSVIAISQAIDGEILRTYREIYGIAGAGAPRTWEELLPKGMLRSEPFTLRGFYDYE